MAAVTVASTTRSNIGDFTFHIVKMTGVSSGDTYDSNIQGIVAYWAAETTKPGTQASAGMAVTESSDTFTMEPGEDTQDATLFIISKS